MADITVTAANVKIGASDTTVQRVQYGATVTQGQPVYSDSTASNKYKPADADALASAEAVGIAVTPGGDTDYGLIVTSGLINPGGTVAIGQIYCVSVNAGGIAPYADVGVGDYVTVLGVGTTAALIDVDISVSGIAKA